MPIYQLFTLVSLSFVKKVKTANFLNFCKQILLICIVSLNSCVCVCAYRRMGVRALVRVYACALRVRVLPYHLPTF